MPFRRRAVAVKRARTRIVTSNVKCDDITFQKPCNCHFLSEA
jgi:hypothetical protein